MAAAFFQAGGLRNTFVFAAASATMIEAERGGVANLRSPGAGAAAFVGSEHEHWAIRHAYALASTANFSRSILEFCLGRLHAARAEWYLARPSRQDLATARHGAVLDRGARAHRVGGTAEHSTVTREVRPSLRTGA
jgi:hypothetical protein